MKNKKVFLATILFCIVTCAILLFVFLTKNTKSIIIGTWEIQEFIVDENIVPFDKIGEYYGTEFQDAYDLYSVTFKKDGSAVIISPTFREDKTRDIECKYEINDNIITLLKPEEDIEAFEIQGNSLHALKGIIPFDGAILKRE